MKKTDIQIVLFIIIVAIIGLVGFKFLEGKKGDANYVIITYGEESKIISLSDPQIVVIDYNGHHNEIEITNDGVRMLESSCDNQNCILQGKASLENINTRILGGWIVCLPNEVTIELVKGDSNEN